MRKNKWFVILLIALQSLPLAGLAEAAPTAGLSDGGASTARALIVYFSCTGNTRAAAETLQGLTGADLYELVPETPYTPADLDYNDPTSRANQEIQNDAARPAVAGHIDNFESYGVIYVGYPIWWGSLPPILRTFWEAYDFSGKTVLPFCTSGGSGIEASVAAIRALLPDSDVGDGLRVKGGGAEAQFKKWLDKE